MFIFDDLPLLLASYESGNNRLILIPPNKPSYIVLYEFKNYNEKDGKKYLIKILSCCYDKKSKILFTGDFFGVVDCYSLKNFFSIGLFSEGFSLSKSRFNSFLRGEYTGNKIIG